MTRPVSEPWVMELARNFLHAEGVTDDEPTGAFVVTRGTMFTVRVVAVTESELFVLRMSRIHLRRAVAVDLRLPRAGAFELVGGSERSIRLGGVRYQVHGGRPDTARRLVRPAGSGRIRSPRSSRR